MDFSHYASPKFVKRGLLPYICRRHVGRLRESCWVVTSILRIGAGKELDGTGTTFSAACLVSLASCRRLCKAARYDQRQELVDESPHVLAVAHADGDGVGRKEMPSVDRFQAVAAGRYGETRDDANTHAHLYVGLDYVRVRSPYRHGRRESSHTESVSDARAA